MVKIDNRILDLESPKQEVLASDNQRIDVDAFVRYRIVDPLRFYQSVGSIRGANNLLASVLNSAVRRVLGEATQQQIVRDERAGLMVKIKEQVNSEASNSAFDVVDARVRRADLPREISEKVFSRMQIGTPARSERISRAGQRAVPEDHLARRPRRDRAEGRSAAGGRSASAARATPNATASSRKRSARIPTSSPSIARCRPTIRASRPGDTRFVTSPDARISSSFSGIRRAASSREPASLRLAPRMYRRRLRAAAADCFRSCEPCRPVRTRRFVRRNAFRRGRGARSRRGARLALRAGGRAGSRAPFAPAVARGAPLRSPISRRRSATRSSTFPRRRRSRPSAAAAVPSRNSRRARRSTNLFEEFFKRHGQGGRAATARRAALAQVEFARLRLRRSIPRAS